MPENQNQFQGYDEAVLNSQYQLPLNGDEELLRLLRPEILTQPGTLEGVV
jgi:hypothetical protein